MKTPLLCLTLLSLATSFMLRMSSIVVRKATEADISKMGIRSWPTWGCEVSRFPWTYGESETCYIIRGRVTVTPTQGEPVTIEAGDLATFPEGMSCTWDVTEALSKHYSFH